MPGEAAVNSRPGASCGPRLRYSSFAVAELSIPLLNRELSWLEFNRRVLAEAEDPAVPLLERVKFLSIAATNLDEFLMVRVGTVRQLIAGGVREKSADGLTPRQQLKVVRERVKRLLRDMYRVESGLTGELRAAGIRIERESSLTAKQRALLAEEFERRVAPVLTPLAVDPGHPFPFLSSGAINVAVLLGSGTEELHTAFIKVPRVLPRFIDIPETTQRFLPIEELICAHAAHFFPGLDVKEVIPFRVIRNADIMIREDEVEDLLQSMETAVRRRDRREVVWIEIAHDPSEHLLSMLLEALELTREDVFPLPSLPKLGDLMEIPGRIGKPSLVDEPFDPRTPPELASGDDIFSILRAGDVVLHRPYDSYAAVVELMQSAADDPDVLAIKQTLYRTEPHSVIVEALTRAAERGKQVTAIIEVQARFDEERNIAWARQLEQAGVQVVYGLMGTKTHCKVCLIVRREGGELRSYLHLSTGNYNAKTARLYTDLDLLTTHPDFGADAVQLINLLTGFSASTAHELFEGDSGNRAELQWKQFVIAPTDYHPWVLRMIARETQNARDGKPARIVAKMNALVEPKVIAALYGAAEAGVKIDLIVRGICCLVPRENIRVISIIDRFLEHSRIMLFGNAGDPEVWVTSGDWMPRNFFRRIEVTWPILSPAARDRIERQIFGVLLADDTKAWKLHPDGTYRRRRPGPRPLRSQQRFIEIARAEAEKIGPYEESMRRPAAARRKVKRKK